MEPPGLWGALQGALRVPDGLALARDARLSRVACDARPLHSAKQQLSRATSDEAALHKVCGLAFWHEGSLA